MNHCHHIYTYYWEKYLSTNSDYYPYLWKQRMQQYHLYRELRGG